MLGAFFGASSGTLGGLSPLAADSHDATLGLGISSAAAGGLSALAAALAGVAAETYTLDDCPAVLGEAH